MSSNVTKTEIEIPNEAFTPCPKEKFSLVNINTHCLLCDFFNGLYSKSENKAALFSKQFTVKCARPSSRDIVEVKF